MTEIYPTNLKKGITYRIVHKDGQIEEQVGVFDSLVGTRPNVNARFTDIQGENIFPSPDAAYRIDEWKFLMHDSGDPQPVADGGRRRRKTKKSKRRSRKTRRSRK
jgi:hypothetical protein